MKLLNNFKNQVLCRRESNQNKASKIWEELKNILTQEEIYDINDDWIHYMINQITTDQFGQTLQKIINKYD